MSISTPVGNDSPGLRWKVFLSSTFKELRKYRDAVHGAYENDPDLRSRIQLIEMEDALPGTDSAEKYCERLVRESDLMILLVGNQLGSMIPPEMNWSYTEWEFFTAREIGLPLLYVPLSADAPDLQSAEMELDVEMEARCADLRKAAEEQPTTRPGNRLLDSMQNPDGMAAQLMKALHQWLDYGATPRRIASGRRFVGHWEEYRRLRASIDSRSLSVVAGPPGMGKSTLGDALSYDPDIKRAFRPIIDIPIVADYQTASAELQRKILGSVLGRLCTEYGIVDPQDSLSVDLESLTVAIRSAIAEFARSGQGAEMPLVLIRIGAIWGGNDADDGVKNALAIADACRSLPTLARTVVETSDERIVLHLQNAHRLDPGDVIRPENFSAQDGLEFLYSLGDSGRSAGVLHHFDRDNGIPCRLCAQRGERLSEHLGGSPQLLAVAGRALQRNNIHEDLRHVDQLLRSHGSGENKEYRALELAIARLGDREQKALIAASILLPKPYAFSASAVAAMCHDPDETPWNELSDGKRAELVVGWRKSLEHLQERCLIEGIEGDHEEAEQDVFKIHPNISFAVQHWCETGDRIPELNTLRDRAFEFYDKDLIEFLESSSLLSWYELENAVWSGHLLDWLHLLMYTDGRGKDIGGKMEALVRLYLKAHWWWGGYVTFPLSNDLVDFARQRTDIFAARAKAVQAEGSELTPDGVQALAEALDGFDRSYPKLGELRITPAPQAVGERWPQVAVHLREVAELLGIPMAHGTRDFEPGPEESDGWRGPMRTEIREYLHVFSGHAERFGCPQRPLPPDVIGRIDDCYHVAIDLAAGDDDLWNLGWYQMECADAWFDAMELETALERNQGAEDTVRLYEGSKDGDYDFELRANIERLHGDIRWAQGHQHRAWDHYVRALYYGLYTQLYRHCDTYTVRFYEEQMWRASGRLLEMARLPETHPAAEVRQLVRRARAAFGLAEVPEVELSKLLAGPDTPTTRHRMEALFPRKPVRDQRWRARESDYASTVRHLLGEARQMFPDLLDPPMCQ